MRDVADRFWISSARGRFVPPSSLCVSCSGKAFMCGLVAELWKPGTLGGNSDFSLGWSIATSLSRWAAPAPCLSQLLVRDFGAAPALLDGVGDWQ